MQDESKSSTLLVKQSTVNDFAFIATEVSEISVFVVNLNLKLS